MRRLGIECLFQFEETHRLLTSQGKKICYSNSFQYLEANIPLGIALLLLNICFQKPQSHTSLYLNNG